MSLFCFIFNGGFGGLRRFRELIIKWIDPQPGEKIIDICCGTAEPDKKWKAWLFDFMERFNPEYPTYKILLKSGLIHEIKQADLKIFKTDKIFWEFFQVVLAEKRCSQPPG
jgi:type I restriction-modification system DNA methylase subunit